MRIPSRKLTIFGLACVMVACGYITYRALAVLGPNGFGSFIKTKAAVITEIGCAEGDEATAAAVTDQARIVPASQQRLLANQTPISKNLIQNPAIEEVNADTQTPRDYARTVENSTVDYKLRYDNAKQPYLHIEQSVSQDIGASWVAGMVAVQPGDTYAYSFSYRSDTSALVTAETVSGSGEHSYRRVAQLSKSNEWRTFTYYFLNAEAAKAFRFIVSPTAIGSLDTKDFNMHQIGDARLPVGMVSVTFDDGWQSIADKARPLLDEFGIRTTQYIIADAARQKVRGYMTYPTITALKHRGHEIGSHSLAHCNQAHLSEKDVQKNAEQSKRELQEQNLGPIESFAYPYGSYSEKSQHINAKKYSLIRTSDEGYNDRYFDNQNIRSFAITNHTTDKEFQGWLDYAKNNRVWLVLVYHHVDEQGEYNVTSKNLRRQLQMIHNSQLPALPLAEAARKIR
jgi:peptidoglycan/xylan/chitin deacetylase (PgdA/CDA1 family)